MRVYVYATHVYARMRAMYARALCATRARSGVKLVGFVNSKGAIAPLLSVLQLAENALATVDKLGSLGILRHQFVELLQTTRHFVRVAAVEHFRQRIMRIAPNLAHPLFADVVAFPFLAESSDAFRFVVVLSHVHDIVLHCEKLGVTLALAFLAPNLAHAHQHLDRAVNGLDRRSQSMDLTNGNARVGSDHAQNLLFDGVFHFANSLCAV